MLIEKIDFTSELVEFSQEILDSEINPHIQHAVKFDLKVLEGELYNDILALDGETIDLEAEPANELHRFFEDFVKPYLVLCAFCRYLAVCNIKNTAAGLRSFHESFSDNISAGDLNRYISHYQQLRSNYLLEMMGHLGRVRYVLNGKNYQPGVQTQVNNQVYTGGVRVIGRKRF